MVELLIVRGRKNSNECGFGKCGTLCDKERLKKARKSKELYDVAGGLTSQDPCTSVCVVKGKNERH